MGEIEPLLILPVGSDIKIGLYFEVSAASYSYQVVGEVGSKSIRKFREVKDPAPIENFGEWNNSAIRAKVAATDLIGFFIEVVPAFNKVKLSCHSDVRQEIDVEVGSTTVEPLTIVRVGR